MSKRTRKPTLKLIESLQSGADEFCLSGEDTVLSGTEDCWLEDIDLKYVYVLCLCIDVYSKRVVNARSVFQEHHLVVLYSEVHLYCVLYSECPLTEVVHCIIRISVICVSPYSSLGFAGMGDEVVREKPLTQALPPPTSGGKGEGLTKPAKWTTTPGSSRHHRKPSWLMISEI